MPRDTPHELIFVSHEGKSRAPVSVSERKRTNSALQKRSWQRKVLGSAKELRSSAQVPPTWRWNLCSSCWPMSHEEDEAVPKAEGYATAPSTPGICSKCGRATKSSPSPPIASPVSNGNLGPFNAFVIRMTPEMQRLLSFSKQLPCIGAGPDCMSVLTDCC